VGKGKVLMANPFYHTYAGAAVVAGGEPAFLPAGPETGFLPDPDAVPVDLLKQAPMVYLFSWVRLAKSYRTRVGLLGSTIRVSLVLTSEGVLNRYLKISTHLTISLLHLSWNNPRMRQPLTHSPLREVGSHG